MPLPGSGPISLNDIHIEAGGSSGTQASINDADIRGLISKGSGVSMNFAEWYGASAAPTFILPSTGTDDITVTANRVGTGQVYGGIEIQTDGDWGRRLSLTSNLQPGFTDLGDWVDPKSDANASEYQFRVGDFSGVTQPSRRNAAIVIPTGAIASQSWNNLSTNPEWYYALDGTTESCIFNLQLRHIASEEVSGVAQCSMEVSGGGFI